MHSPDLKSNPSIASEKYTLDAPESIQGERVPDCDKERLQNNSPPGARPHDASPEWASAETVTVLVSCHKAGNLLAQSRSVRLGENQPMDQVRNIFSIPRKVLPGIFATLGLPQRNYRP